MLIYAACLPIWALTVSPILNVLIYNYHLYRGLADAELFRGGADGRPVFYEVKGQLPGPLFQILSDRAPLLYTFAAGLCIWRARRVYAFGLLRGGLCPLELPL